MSWALQVEDPDLSSKSSDAYLLHLLLLLPLLHDSMGQSVLVSILGIFSVPGPTTHTKMIFISTPVTIFAPCWAFSWWVRLSTSATCLTWGTLCFVAITFLEVEALDLINGCCCGNSTTGLMLVQVFYCHLVLLGMLEKA